MALDFRVQGKGMGDEVVLKGPARVRIEARVRFDPERDNVARLEVILNGRVVRSVPRVDAAGRIQSTFEMDIEESSWLAVRAAGRKLGESVPKDGLLPPYRDRDRGAFAAHAHSAPIFVTIENTPRISQRARASAVAQSWIARLDELEALLSEDRIGYLAARKGDMIPSPANLRRNRANLLEAIRNARASYLEMGR